MKKLLTMSAILIMALILPTYALAQGGQQGNPQGAQQGQQQGLQEPGTGNGRAGTGVQNLNRVAERINNPEIGEQIRSMAQNHEKVQTRTKTALHQMSQKNQALKLLVGPDYKNAGQVRSDVVGLRNDVKRLEKIKEGSLPEDAEAIQDAINEVQLEAGDLEAQLTEELSGFSLFGWLAKMLAE